MSMRLSNTEYSHTPTFLDLLPFFRFVVELLLLLLD